MSEGGRARERCTGRPAAVPVAPRSPRMLRVVFTLFATERARLTVNVRDVCVRGLGVTGVCWFGYRYVGMDGR